MARRSVVSAALGALSVAVLLTGCSAGGASSTPSAHTGEPGVIRTTMQPVDTLDPTLATTYSNFYMARMSYDTLVRRDNSGFVGGLARSWQLTPTGAVFTIRNDASCADGTKITPTVVKNGLDFRLRPDASQTMIPLVFGAGVKPTITADDGAATLTIDTGKPWPFLLDGLAMAAMGIVCPAGIADPAGLAAGTVPAAASGPYTISKARPGVEYDFTLRHDYKAWPAWTSKIDGKPANEITYEISSDATAIANQLLSGALDISQVQPWVIDRFKGNKDFTIAKADFSDWYLQFNEAPGHVTADEDVRKAIVAAIDRTQFNQTTTNGMGTMLTSLAAPGVDCVPDKNPALPTGAGKPSAVKALQGKTINFIGPNIIGANGAGLEYIAQALRSAGATVNLDNADSGTWVSTVVGQPDKWDINVWANMNFLQSLVQPLNNFIGPPIAKGGGNWTGVDNPAASGDLATALAATDSSASCRSLNDAVDALVARSDVLPLVNNPYIYVSAPGFRAYRLGNTIDDPIFRILG